MSSGKVLLSGGSSNPTTPPAEIFDPSVNTFTAINIGRLFSSSYLTATLLVDNRVLLAGGEGQVIFVKCNEEEKLEEESTVFAALFDSSAAGFSYTGTTARSRHTATLLPNGGVLVIGGFAANNNPLASAELYH